MAKGNITSQQDTGWGVIYRLNDLYREVEVLAPTGKYNDWSFKLDRIWSNLMYRNNFSIQWDEKKKKVISIEFDEEAYAIKIYLDNQIAKAKGEMSKARKGIPPEQPYKNKKSYVVAKNTLYKAIMMKEIWLRKYMQQLGLYLKEVEHNPAGSMWGK